MLTRLRDSPTNHRIAGCPVDISSSWTDKVQLTCQYCSPSLPQAQRLLQAGQPQKNLSSLRSISKSQQHLPRFFIGAECRCPAIGSVDMHTPCKYRPPCNLELGCQISQPAIVWPERDAPTPSLSISQWLRNAVTELILHKRNNAMPLPTPNSKGKSNIIYYCWSLRNISD